MNLRNTKHLGATCELVTGGEPLKAAVGVSRELFVVGSETPEASVGAKRELIVAKAAIDSMRELVVARGEMHEAEIGAPEVATGYDHIVKLQHKVGTISPIH